jgi:uncharacterized protein YggE
MFAKSKPFLFILAAAALVLSAYGVMVAQAGGARNVPVAPQAQTVQENRRTLSVNGTGQVSVAPDIAYVTIGVHTQDPDAKTAVDSNTEATEALKAALIAFGVAENDIQTTNFNIYSFEDYQLPVDPESQKPPMTYSVDNSVFVTVRDISGLGDLLSTAVDAGANNIWGIQFDLTDKSEAISEARAAAVASARSQAEELATLAEVEQLRDRKLPLSLIFENEVPAHAVHVEIAIVVEVVHDDRARCIVFREGRHLGQRARHECSRFELRFAGAHVVFEFFEGQRLGLMFAALVLDGVPHHF